MKKENINNRLVYPMGILNDTFTEEEISTLSENYEFNPNDAYFHADLEKGMLESLTEEDVKMYNENVPTDKQLIVHSKVTINVSKVA